VLTGDQFVDKSVAQAWATLLDEGTHLCSQSSMHRILRANHAAENDVRRHSTRPARSGIRSRPGPVRCGARTAPKLRGPQRGVYFELYVILDIFSRYVVGWTVAPGLGSAMTTRTASPSSRPWSTAPPSPRADARAFCEQFFGYYTTSIATPGLGCTTRASVHHDEMETTESVPSHVMDRRP